MKTTKDKSSFVQATSLDQQYFTVRISDDWVEDISVLFGPNVTWKEINERLRNRPVAIVTSVTYGRSVHFLKEFSSESFNLNASQSGGSKAGNKMSFKQAIADSTSAKNYELINIGGSNTLNAILNSKDMSTEDIHKALSKSLAFSPSDQGVPVAYTICLITGENPGTKIKPLFDGVY
ncbi:MAG: thiol-activated cytolysin, partial [Bacteroidia bacterium]